MSFPNLASREVLLDALLEGVTVQLQLTHTQHRYADDRYHGIYEWLSAPESPLLDLLPDLYPQGSMQLKTTVRPTSHVEYDLDIVCLMTSGDPMSWNAVELCDLIAARLLTNKTYADRMTRKAKCIRIAYANNFHLDLIPALPDRVKGGTAILVANREKNCWFSNDPKGYAAWFDRCCHPIAHFSGAKSAKIEPLPAYEPALQKASLRRTVQLWKRHRDVALNGCKFSPPSIVLTTLAGMFYDGTILCGPALARIVDKSRSLAAVGGRFTLPNPINSEEDLVQTWTDTDFREFAAFNDKFQTELEQLQMETGLPKISERIGRLFGDESFAAISQFGTEFRHAIDDGNVRRSPCMTMLTTSASGRKVRPATFYGR